MSDGLPPMLGPVIQRSWSHPGTRDVHRHGIPLSMGCHASLRLSTGSLASVEKTFPPEPKSRFGKGEVETESARDPSQEVT